MAVWHILFSCTVYANELYLHISISENTSLPRTRPLATRSAPFSGTRYWYPSHSLWVLQSFCSTSPWRPLFQLALIYFLSLVAMPTLARRRLHYTCTMETNCEENHLNQHQSLQCQNTSWHETVTRHESNRELNAEKKIISMNSNAGLLFLARLTCLIETVVDFPIQTPLEFCIVNKTPWKHLLTRLD